MTLGTDTINRQAVLCHRVLRTLQQVAQGPATLDRETWESLLLFLIGINDALLAPPAMREDAGEQLCERVLGVLLEVNTIREAIHAFIHYHSQQLMFTGASMYPTDDFSFRLGMASRVRTKFSFPAALENASRVLFPLASQTRLDRAMEPSLFSVNS